MKRSGYYLLEQGITEVLYILAQFVLFTQLHSIALSFLKHYFGNQCSQQIKETEENAKIWARLLTNGKTPESIHESVVARRGSSVFGASANFAKGMLGAGLLSLPNAFFMSGLVTGLFTYFFTLILCTMACALLLMCKREANLKLKGSAYDGPILTYLDLATVASPRLAVITSFFFVMCSITFCTGWIIVINGNISKHLPEYMANEFALPIFWVFPIVLLLSYLRYTKYLVYVSYFGCFVYLIGVIGLSLTYALSEFSLDGLDPSWITRFNIADFPIFMSKMLYPFAVFIATLPLEATLTNPKKGYTFLFLTFPVIGIIALLYGVMVGSTPFGKCGVILDCLPRSFITTLSEFVLAAVLACTFPLGLQYSFDLIEAKFFTERTKLRYLITERTILCIAACVVGALVPNFSVFTSFVSPLLFSVLGFILPPLFYIKIKTRKQMSTFGFICCCLLMMFGVAFTIVGTFQAIRSL